MELHQVYLMTTDLDRSTAFYRALGFEVADEGSRSVEFQTGRTRLKLEADFTEETLDAFGLDLPGADRGSGVIVVLNVSDVDAVAESADAATEHGGRVLAGPRDVDWGRRLLLLEDPDSYVIEISEPL